MQDIADENTPAEGAFYTHTANGYSVKWFSPAVEADLSEFFSKKGE
jgi:predicted PhzF superfamily epimerase YddE/YHI9